MAGDVAGEVHCWRANIIGDRGDTMSEDEFASETTEETADTTKQRDAERGTLIILALVGVAVLLGIVSVLTRDDAPTRIAPTPNPFLTFTTVRNSCGQCGTSSPVGGWEAADGRALILSADGDFRALFADGTSMNGDWTQSGRRLCLQPDIGGESCFTYEQRIDAMRLDEAVYIRR